MYDEENELGGWTRNPRLHVEPALRFEGAWQAKLLEVGNTSRQVLVEDTQKLQGESFSSSEKESVACFSSQSDRVAFRATR